MKNKFLDRLSSPLDRIEGAIFFFVLSPLFVIYALKYTPEGQQPVVRVAMAVLVFLLLRRLIKTLDAQARGAGNLTTAARNGRNALFALAVLGGLMGITLVCVRIVMGDWPSWSIVGTIFAIPAVFVFIYCLYSYVKDSMGSNR